MDNGGTHLKYSSKVSLRVYNLSSIKISETYRAVSDQSDNVIRLILGPPYISEDTIKRFSGSVREQPISTKVMEDSSRYDYRPQGRIVTYRVLTSSWIYSSLVGQEG